MATESNSNRAPGALLLPFGDATPRVADDAFVAPGAVVIGDVEIGSAASVWFGCVVRGDVHFIRIGARSNVQDGTIIHVSRAGAPTRIGEDVTIGHGCIIHACTLETRAFVGMGATILDEAVVETDAMLAAGSLLTARSRVPTGELWAGRPAKLLRRIRPEELRSFADRAHHYVALAAQYRAERG